MNRTNLIMMAVIIVLASVYLISGHLQDKKAREEADSKRLFLEAKGDELSRIKVERKSGQAYELLKKNGGWYYRDQLMVGGEMRSLADGLAELSSETTVEEKPNAERLAEFGLDQPGFKIEFEQGEKIFHLVIGKRTPPGDHFYVRTSDESPVVTVNAFLGGTLEKDLDELREKSPLAVEPGKVKRLKVVLSDGSEIELEGTRPEKDDKAEFEAPMEYRLVKPVEAPADPRAVTDYIWRWKNLKAARFLGEGEKEEWKSIILRLETEDEDGHTAVAEVAEAVPVKPNLFYARRLNPEEGLILDLEGEEELLEPTPLTFRERHLVVFDVDDVSRLKGKIGAQEVDFKKSSFGWKDGEKVGDLIWKIKDLQWAEPAPEGSKLGEVRADLELFKDKQSLGQFRLGQQVEGKTLVELAGKLYVTEGDPVVELEALVKSWSATASPTPDADNEKETQ